MLSRSQVMTKAVCQCSEALTTNQEMFAAYDADKLFADRYGSTKRSYCYANCRDEVKRLGEALMPTNRGVGVLDSRGLINHISNSVPQSISRLALLD